jgi:two-component system, cell cycle response regulator
MSALEQQTAPAQHEHGALCVVVVGRTALERALRADPEIELIRSRTALDALGEVATALADAHYERVGVLVAHDAVEAREMPDLLSSLRTLAAGARIVGAVGDPGVDGLRFPDGSVDALAPDAADAQAVRGLLMGDAYDEQSPKREQPRTPAANTPPAKAPTGERAPSPATSNQTPEPAPSRDVALVERLLAGGSLMGEALAELRRRPGLAKLQYTPIDAEAPTDGAAVPVERSGRVLGRLSAPGATEAALRDAARWLAAWLALDEQHRQLQTAAFTDELTGAWNRRYFQRFLARAIEQARASRRDVTLMLYDIDDFKVYNDQFGHAAGDEILRETVRLLQSVVRPTDRVCRIGGDEFGVIFDDPRGPRSEHSHHPVSIAEIAERFQRQICAHRFPKLGEQAMSTLTVSGGMATFPWDGHDVESLMQRADELALESKRQGKNVITLGPGAQRVCRLRFGDEPSESDSPAPPLAP